MAILGDDTTQQSLAGRWENKPYPYQPGGTFLEGGGQGGGIMGGQGSNLASLMGAAKSLYEPSQPIPQEQPRPASPPPGPPQYNFGPSDSETGPNAGEESKQFASAIGQGVLGASQAAAAQAQAQAQRKKQQGMPGGQPSGASGGLGAGFGSGGIMGGEV